MSQNSPHHLSRSQQKGVLRQEALARRGALLPEQRIEAALSLCDHAADLQLMPGAIVSGYWPIRDEMDPRPLLDCLRRMGHPLCLPVVAEPHLLFRQFDRDGDLVPAGLGTHGPSPDAPEVIPDVLLMPLSAFDGLGNRIGYGKGHYDMAIAALEKTKPLICIGLAFSVQEVASVPAEEHDRPLDAILTETGLRRFR